VETSFLAGGEFGPKSADSPDDYVRLMVTDTGCGMTEQQRPRYLIRSLPRNRRATGSGSLSCRNRPVAQRRDKRGKRAGRAPRFRFCPAC
jgi:hypothetical protein